MAAAFQLGLGLVRLYFEEYISVFIKNIEQHPSNM